MTATTRVLDMRKADEPEAPRKKKLTEEQMQAVRLFLRGGNVAVKAGAGTGKTSTLVAMARNAPKGARGQYVAFNRAIVASAGSKLPSNTSARTAHSLAFADKGRQFRRRLDNSRRMRSQQIAGIIGLHGSEAFGDKVLSPGVLAGIVMGAVGSFCQSADQEITVRHFEYQNGIDQPNADGSRTYAGNRELARAMLPFARQVWEDCQDPYGRLPFKHDYYLKMWELDDPVIRADFILFDEAQDASPVLVSAVEKQTDAQLVWVGDDNQQIYSFTGAVNALSKIAAEHQAMLTQSFRFGQPIADVANEILSWLPTSMKLTGYDEIHSTVGFVEQPDAILARTNATTLAEYIVARAEEGRRPYIVGGGQDQLRFAEAVLDLQQFGSTDHRDLACFSSWCEVQEYVDQDAQGKELRLLVKIVDKFGARVIVQELQAMPEEADADLFVSTAHKAKGLEWGRVRLAGDFPEPRAPKPGEEPKSHDEENRLLYVAATRAQRELDVDAVAHLAEGLGRS